MQMRSKIKVAGRGDPVDSVEKALSPPAKAFPDRQWLRGA